MRVVAIGLVVVAVAVGAWACTKNARRTPTRADAGVIAELPKVVDAAVTVDAGEAEVAFCAADTECGWDDPCAATRCVGAKAAGPGNCDKSRPPPGACRCVNHRCTLQPKAEIAAQPGPACQSGADCSVDFGGGVCVTGGQSGGPIETEGPVCACQAGTCQLEWAGPVPCETFQDCSMASGPLRPVPSSQVPRANPKPVRPCKDGERDSVCGKDKRCHIVAWSC